MSKSIIEKLGITPGPWAFDIDDIECRVHKGFEDIGYLCGDSNVNVIASAPEMLEALITTEKNSCRKGCGSEIYQKEICGNCTHAVNKRIIEKATGKSWEEIKELLK